jgi:hypothetical protein
MPLSHVHHWHLKLCTTFFSLESNPSAADQAVLYKPSPQDKHLIILTVHVNNCTITASTTRRAKDLKAGLSHHIEATHLSIQAMRDVPYCEAVRARNQAAHTMCIEIALAIATVARCSANPRPTHWEAAKQIHHYLADTHNLWLSYGETRQVLEEYTDMDANGPMAKHQPAFFRPCFSH